MVRHILLERAFNFPIVRAPADSQYPDWRYDRRVGAWVSATTGDLMVATNPKPSSPPTPRPRPVSKKADLETGEDMKGE